MSIPASTPTRPTAPSDFGLRISVGIPADTVCAPFNANGSREIRRPKSEKRDSQELKPLITVADFRRCHPSLFTAADAGL
jgi:hypothetical protein